MRLLRRLALATGLLVLAARADASGVGAAPGLPPALPPPGVPFYGLPPLAPPPAWCWVEVRLFESLRTGPVDYCRRRLRYRPGALECYRIVDNVCMAPTAAGQWITGRSPLRREVIPCPRGPEPPMCRQLDLE